MRRIIIPLSLMIILIIFTATNIFIYNLPQSQTTQEFPDNYVIRVIDGDTIQLFSKDVVRLICINAPEKGKPGFEEAKDFLENLVLNKEVITESDIQDKDSYGRLLRYVYLNDSKNIIFVNKEIYKQGYAEMMIIPPSDSRCNEIIS